MDIASIIGIVLALVLMIIAIITGEEGVKGIVAFLDPGSALITFGGAFSVILATTPSIKDYVKNYPEGTWGNEGLRYVDIVK